MTEWVWDLHFLENDIVEIATLGGRRDSFWQLSGIVYHVFSTESDAKEFASRYLRQSVIQHRQWATGSLDSPFVKDHRRPAHEA